MGYIDPTHFWAFTSSTGDEGEPFDERKDPAWHADLPGPSRFRAGMPVELWDPSMAIEVERGRHSPRTTPDVLSASGNFVVSDRCRSIIERLAPGHVQFLGFVPRPRDCEITNGPLWILNALRVVDCIDMALSNARPPAHEYDTYHWGTPNPVVDSRRVSTGDMIFRLKHYTIVTLVRKEVRDAIRDGGLTGGGFYRWRWWTSESGDGLFPAEQHWPAPASR